MSEEKPVFHLRSYGDVTEEELEKYTKRKVKENQSTMKDHEIAQVVNALRDLAVQYHNHQSLRERIAYIIVPLLKEKQ